VSFGGVRFNSGKSFIVGHGIPVSTPIALVPAEWEGALVYADDGDMYFSDGDDWVIISDAPIRRPTALLPITAEHFRQLRLSAFLTGAGFTFTQTGIIFRVSLSPDMTNPILNEVVTTTTGNSYTLPANFVPPETTFYWQGKYLATGNQESQFSKVTAQVFPNPIATPVPLTQSGATSLTLSVSPFESAFGYSYGNTIWELYASTTATTPLITVTNTSYVFRFPDYIPTVVPGATYFWRAKFRNTTTIESNWSALRPVVMDQFFTVRDTTNVSYFVGRTIPDSLLTPFQVPSTVLSSNGTPYVCP
jgi:hypothetical protein